MRFKINLATILGIITVFIGTSKTDATCRSKTVTTTTSEITIAVPFAIPVGVPVATFAPYFYSAGQFQSPQATGVQAPSTQSITATPSSVHATTAPDSQPSNNSSLVATRCATCHGGPSPKANFSLEHLENLSFADRLNAIRAVATNKMPKGGHLSNDEIRAIIGELSSTSPDNNDAAPQASIPTE